MAVAASARRPLARRVLRRLRPPRLGRTVWLLLALALALRMALVLATTQTSLTLDPADWDGHGLSIAQGHGYPPSNRAPAGGPSAFRPPGYPLFLAGVYVAIQYHAPLAARLVEALLGTLVVGLVGLIATRLWGRRVGVLALALAAVSPPLVVLSTALVSEAVFVPLVLGALAAALQARRSAHPLRWAMATGLLTGLAELTRTNAAVLLVPFALAVWTQRPRLRPRALLAPALVVVTAVLAVAPWTIRNALVLHAFVPVSTQVGYTLAGTYNQASRDDRHWPAVWKEAEHGASPEYDPIVRRATVFGWSELTLGRRLQEAAMADIRRDPVYVLRAGGWNTLRILHLTELDFAFANLADTDIPHGAAALEIFGLYPLLLLALVGLLTRRARRTPAWVWLVPLLLATTVFVTGFIRFRAPMDPFLVMLAALGLSALGSGVTRWRARAGRAGP